MPLAQVLLDNCEGIFHTSSIGRAKLVFPYFALYGMITLVFFTSENITAFINTGEHETGDTSFDYAKLDDASAEQARDDWVHTEGFFILPSRLLTRIALVGKTEVKKIYEVITSRFIQFDDCPFALSRSVQNPSGGVHITERGTQVA